MRESVETWCGIRLPRETWFLQLDPHPLQAEFIYGLADASGTIRYVGRTTNPIRRLRQHEWGGGHASTFSNAAGRPWQRDRARMVVIECTTTDQAGYREMFWIGALREKAELMNALIPGKRLAKYRYITAAAAAKS